MDVSGAICVRQMMVLKDHVLQDGTRISHEDWPNLHRPATRVHPIERHLRLVCSGRFAKPPDAQGLESYRSDCLRTILCRGFEGCMCKIPFMPDLPSLSPHCCSCFQIPVGGAIASEGKGEYMYVSGKVLDLEVSPY